MNNSMNRGCGCNCNCNKENNVIEEKLCSNVSNYDDCLANYNLNYNKCACCECGYDEADNGFPENPMFGQSYVPVQRMNKTFKPCVGLKMGTLFPELVSPYMPCQSIAENEYIAATNKIKGGCNDVQCSK